MVREQELYTLSCVSRSNGDLTEGHEVTTSVSEGSCGYDSCETQNTRIPCACGAPNTVASKRHTMFRGGPMLVNSPSASARSPGGLAMTHPQSGSKTVTTVVVTIRRKGTFPRHQGMSTVARASTDGGVINDASQTAGARSWWCLRKVGIHVSHTFATCIACSPAARLLISSFLKDNSHPIRNGRFTCTERTATLHELVKATRSNDSLAASEVTFTCCATGQPAAGSGGKVVAVTSGP